MLRANVSLNRKFNRDSHSADYGVALDGEIPYPTDDVEAVLEKISELFHLAEEALAAEIERDCRHQPNGPESTPTPAQPALPHGHARVEPLPINRPAAPAESATPRQLQYLQNLGKRKRLSRDDLEAVTAQVVGSAKKLESLTKREAGLLINHLTQLEPEATP